MTALPLDPDRVDELKADGVEVVLLDGRPYDREDLHQCDGCYSLHVCSGELDDESLCDDCSADAAEEAEAERDKWAHYRWSVR